MKNLFLIILSVILYGAATNAEAKTKITAQELYEECKSAIGAEDFDRSKCSFYIQGFGQAHAMNILLIAECAKSVDYFEKYLQKAYCINPVTTSLEEFSKKFIEWYENRHEKKRFQDDAYRALTDMMSDPQYCKSNTEEEK